MNKKYNIAIAGTGYVGLSNAILLAQHNHVTAVDIIQEKVDMINAGQSPIVDKEIEEYLQTKELDLTATTDATPYLLSDSSFSTSQSGISYRACIFLK